MPYSTEYPSPLGTITLACDEDAVIGLWFNGQRHYGNILPPETERREHPLLREAKRWLDIYFSGREPDFLPPMRYDSTPFRKCICDIMLTGYGGGIDRKAKLLALEGVDMRHFFIPKKGTAL